MIVSLKERGICDEAGKRWGISGDDKNKTSANAVADEMFEYFFAMVDQFAWTEAQTPSVEARPNNLELLVAAADAELHSMSLQVSQSFLISIGNNDIQHHGVGNQDLPSHVEQRILTTPISCSEYNGAAHANSGNCMTTDKPTGQDWSHSTPTSSHSGPTNIAPPTLSDQYCGYADQFRVPASPQEGERGQNHGTGMSGFRSRTCSLLANTTKE